ncbi:MAG TPA: hypothetical protein VFA73_03220 [Actinomycetota bacterium]|nr:hypothetical protein [Actinomycetota bacterium]
MSFPARAKAARVVAVATSPPVRAAATGVPVLAETRPRPAGPIPSRLAAAWVREEAIAQVSPLATRIQSRASAASAPTRPSQGP